LLIDQNFVRDYFTRGEGATHMAREPTRPRRRERRPVAATRPRPVFDPKSFLAKVGGGKTVYNYRKNQIVFSQGDPANAVFYIQSGKMKVAVLSPQGKEAVVAILGAGDFFGEGCLAGQTRRMATVAAMSDSSVTRVRKTAMIRVLHDEPTFSELFVAYLLGRNIRVEEDLVDQLFNSSEKRLARVLLLMAEFGAPGEPETLIPKITQESLADMIGTTRSRVSFFMNRFRKLGFVEYNGRIRVHKSLLNVLLHDRLPGSNGAKPSTDDPPPLSSQRAEQGQKKPKARTG
jgi:CRP/FNR family transcriptional regulator, cyclic AMP receptor protein